MSLVPTYVRARDGYWYEDPVIEFPEGFICFDDDDPPELVLWRASLVAEPASPDVCRAVLDRVLGPNAHTDLCQPPRLGERAVLKVRGPIKLRPASWQFFRLLARIPAPKRHYGRFRGRRRGDCVLYDFDS